LKKPDPIVEKKVIELLEKFGINYSSWTANDRSKHLNNLVKEYEALECTLEVIDGKLIRVLRVVEVEILSPDKKFRLIETHRVLRNGTVLEAHHDLLSGKVMFGEAIFKAIRREIREEILGGLLAPINSIYRTTVTIQPISESKSYPGLLSQRTVYSFLWNMPQSLFKPEGYREIKPRLTVFFEWVPIEP
jgi:hypothetical protein